VCKRRDLLLVFLVLAFCDRFLLCMPFKLTPLFGEKDDHQLHWRLQIALLLKMFADADPTDQH
jgi:hypothetical protein